MKWIKERDLLIAQTMAFVQSVTGKTADNKTADKPDASSYTYTPSFSPAPPAATATFENALERATDIIESPAIMSPAIMSPAINSAVVKSPPKAVASEPQAQQDLAQQNSDFERDTPMTRASIRREYRAEVLNRVANFRAHQQRFLRERDEYFSSTLKKIHADIDDENPHTPLRK